jgi:hypothetical protein
MTLYEFHFVIGDSPKRPIGMDARIYASTPKEALARFKELLPESFEIPVPDAEAGEFIEICIRPENISIKDMTDQEFSDYKELDDDE